MAEGIYGWKRSAKEQYQLEHPESNQDQTEEPFNDRIIEIIDRSLEYGPELLNVIQPVDFDDSATIIGHQRDPLDEGNKEIDITIADSRKIVAYESKRGSNIKIHQLEKEYHQLQNRDSDQRDVQLILITEQISRPERIDECDCPVTWISWYEVAQRLNNYDPEKNSAFEEICKVFKTVFELENMHSEFTGFKNAHPRQLDYFIREIYFTAPRTETFESAEFVNRRPSDFQDSLNRSHRPLGKKYYEMGLYRPDWNKIDDGFPRSYPCVIIDRGRFESPVEVYAGVSINPGYNDWIGQGVRRNDKKIRQLVEREELDLIFSENTLTHAEKGMEPTIHDSNQIEHWEREDWQEKFNLIFDGRQQDHKRIIFKRNISVPPQQMVSDTINTVREVSDLFLEEIPEIFKEEK